MNEAELLERATTYLHANINPKRRKLIDDIIRATCRRLQTDEHANECGDLRFYRVLSTTMVAMVRAEQHRRRQLA